MAGSKGEEKLNRRMSLFGITMIGVGAMIGAGIFALTGLAAGAAGPALLLALLLNGIIAFLTAMVYAEMASVYPESGGGYSYIKRTLPQPLGFYSGWMSWFGHSVACSLYATAFGSYVSMIFESFNIQPASISREWLSKIFTITIIIVFLAINYWGSSEAGKAGIIVTIIKISIILSFVVFGLIKIIKNPVNSTANFIPFFPKGFMGVLSAMGLTFIAFEGYEIIVQTGEEVEEPKKNIPKAIFSSIAIVLPIYLLVAFVSLGAVESGNQATWQFLGNLKETAIIRSAKQFMPYGELILLAGGLFSTMSALNATVYSSSRVSFAMGRDRNLPLIFSRLKSKRTTPAFAILFSGLIIISMALFFPIEDIAGAADVMFLLLFMLVNVALIRLRQSNGMEHPGFKVPFYPYLPAINILLILLVAVFMFRYSPVAWYTIGGWIIAGTLLHYLYLFRKRGTDNGKK